MEHIDIVSEETTMGIVLNLKIPKKVHQICGVTINGQSVWPEAIGICKFNLTMSDEDDMPVIHIEGYCNNEAKSMPPNKKFTLSENGPDL